MIGVSDGNDIPSASGSAPLSAVLCGTLSPLNFNALSTLNDMPTNDGFKLIVELLGLCAAEFDLM